MGWFVQGKSEDLARDDHHTSDSGRGALFSILILDGKVTRSTSAAYHTIIDYSNPPSTYCKLLQSLRQLSARRILLASNFEGFGDLQNAIAAAFQGSQWLVCL